MEELTLSRVHGLERSLVHFGLLPDRGTRGILCPGCEGAGAVSE